MVCNIKTKGIEFCKIFESYRGPKKISVNCTINNVINICEYKLSGVFIELVTSLAEAEAEAAATTQN